MTRGAAALRYARALFDVVRSEGGDLEGAGRELTGFAELVSGNDLLQRVVTNPAVPAPRKRAIVEDLLARLPAVQSPVRKLLVLLADRDRLVLLPQLAEAYRTRLMDHLNVVRAEVVTAQPLAGDSEAALEQGLARATGRQVMLQTRVEPEILGGAVARVGSTVYDGSVARQLEKTREALAGAAD